MVCPPGVRVLEVCRGDQLMAGSALGRDSRGAVRSAALAPLPGEQAVVKRSQPWVCSLLQVLPPCDALCCRSRTLPAGAAPAWTPQPAKPAAKISLHPLERCQPQVFATATLNGLRAKFRLEPDCANLTVQRPSPESPPLSEIK